MTPFEKVFDSSSLLDGMEDAIKELLAQQFSSKPCLKVRKFASTNMVFDYGEEVCFHFVVCNLGNETICDAHLSDVLPYGMTYVPNSTTINDSVPFNADPSVGLGICLGDIEVRDLLIVRFRVTVSLDSTEVTFCNYGTVCGSYSVCGCVKTYCNQSNVVSIFGQPRSRFEKISAAFCLGPKACLSDVFVSFDRISGVTSGDYELVYATYDIVVRYKDCHSVTEQITKQETATFKIPLDLFDETNLSTEVAQLCFKEKCGKVYVSAYIKLTF